MVKVKLQYSHGSTLLIILQLAAWEDILRGNMVVGIAGIDLAVGVVRIVLCLHFDTVKFK